MNEFTLTAGVTDPVGDCGKFEASIDYGSQAEFWGARIAVYGNDPADAEALRDAILAAWDGRTQVTRLTAERDDLESYAAALRDDFATLQSELTKARELLTQGAYFGPGIWSKQVLEFLAHQSAPAAKCDPVDGDVLPPVGSKVWIELASSGWDEQTVTGYYVWPSHGLDKNVHRVFVRVKDAEGTTNARLLYDVRTEAPAAKGGE